MQGSAEPSAGPRRATPASVTKVSRSTPPSWEYRPHLDGLRAVAVYLVVLFHAETPGFAGGFVGVDVFFVLSGFLVTGVLLTEHAQHDRIRLPRFYARRARRLLPAAAVTLVVVAAVLAFVASPAEQLTRRGDIVAAALYVANWRFVIEATDYFGSDIAASPVLHFWSLSVEEQFYIVWPALLSGLLLVRRRVARAARMLPWAVALLAGVSLVAVLVVSREDVLRAYYGTDMRVYQLMAGATLATLVHAGRLRRIPVWVGGAGLVGLLLVSASALDVLPTTRGIAATACTVAVIWATERAGRSTTVALLSRPSVVSLGRVSYGTYLWHWPLAVVLLRAEALPPTLLWLPIAVGSTVVAYASYHWLEMPVRRTSIWRSRNGAQVALGLGISAAVAGVVFVTLTPATTGPADVDWQAAREDRAEHHQCIDAPVEECTLVAGGEPHVLVVGDSHGAHLLPALVAAAERDGWTLSAMTFQGCPWFEFRTVRRGSEDTRCRQYRDDLVERVVPGLTPDVVVAANRISYVRPVLVDGEEFEPGTPEHDAALAAGVGATLDRMTAAAPVLVVAGFPESPVDVPTCLSIEPPSACAFAPSPPHPGEAAVAGAVAARDRVGMVDLDPAVCDDQPERCPAVSARGTVTRLDEHHLTSTYSSERSQAVWRTIRTAFEELTG